MRLKGKLTKWNSEKAYGFIAPNGGGKHVFIHKRAFTNRTRTPQLNDVITFSTSRDKQGRPCAAQATFSGEKLTKRKAKQRNTFSMYLASIFLVLIITGALLHYLPKNLVLLYLVTSFITFTVYAFDKAKAKRNAWRTPESTLHLLALVGGWPGAIIAQQTLRHKSQKQKFRMVFWVSVMINCSVLTWLMTENGANVLSLF